MEKLVPKDHFEEVAIFRSQVIGGLLHREYGHGELVRELRQLSLQRFRPPDSAHTVTYGVSTLERWYYAWKKHGLTGLMPLPRSDRGYAKALTTEARELLCDIRREHPSASAELILKSTQGQPGQAELTASTLRRLFQSRGLDRVSLQRSPAGTERLRWEASHPGALLHGDVCHLAMAHHKLYIHGLLDDVSRYVPTLVAHESERELDMLQLFVGTTRRHGLWDALYLDNGSTYSGQALATCCARLGVSLIHARPYDPQARGKMERFWRTLREGLLDHLDKRLSKAEVQLRLSNFLERHYHVTPHGSLFGRTPEMVWQERRLRVIGEDVLIAALTTRERRLVSRDGVVSVNGLQFELRQSFLARRRVVIAHCLVPGLPESVCAEYENQRYALTPLDRAANGKTRRLPHAIPPSSSVSFDPHGPTSSDPDAKLPR